jgi:regulator of sigma E protease
MVLLLMITIHEFGHYIAGKKLGFKINEFAIGFGKKLYSKKLKNGEEFSLRLFPLGGYCAFEGEDKESKNPDAFNNQKPWKRLIVLVSGVVFNFLSAIIFAVVLLTAYGYDIPQVVAVEQTSPNYIVQEVGGNWYGLQEGDVIWKVEGKDINFVNDHTLEYLLSSYGVGEEITLQIERDGQKMNTIIELYEVMQEDQPKQVLGISIKPYAFPFFQALARSVPFALGMAWKILAFLWMLITGKVGLSGVGGPITTIGTIASYTQASFAGFLVLLPLIAVNLAVFNLLPFPALDGSRMVFVAIEWIRGKPVNPKIEGMIHFVGLILLLTLVFVADLFQLIT